MDANTQGDEIRRIQERPLALQVAGGILALAIAFFAVAWPWIASWKIRADLGDYARQARASDCSLQEKLLLLDRIEGIDDQLRDGASPGYLRWRKCDQAVRAMFADGLTSEEVVLIDRELTRVQRGLIQ